MKGKKKYNKNYPKVLIVGQSFNLKGGGGITLTNLFKDWPHDKLAVATMDIDPTGYKYCRNYYRLGFLELKRPWPFYYFQPKINSGIFHPDDLIDNQDLIVNVKPEGEKKGIKGLYHNLLEFTGLKPLIYRLNTTELFYNWFDSFNPDIVYTQLSDLPSINFVKQIIRRSGKPLVIHIMDDWPNTLKYPGLLFYYWKYRLNKEFRSLLNYAKVLMSICPAMSEEYLNRYGREFLPFQNTIDIDRFSFYFSKNWGISRKFRLFYAGRIGRGTYNSVLKIADAVEMLGQDGMEIQFIIRTNRIPSHYEEVLRKHRHTVIKNYLPHEKIPKELSEMDALIIPLDFVEIDFTRLSMPTKVPEYLASGTPIIIFAPKSTALYKYASVLKWGLTVAENKTDSLAQAIKDLYTSRELREKLGKTARKIALKNHDGLKIRDDFRKALISAGNELNDKQFGKKGISI